MLAILLLTPKDVTFRNHAISFVHDKKGYSYIDKTGRVLVDVQDGTKFLAFFNPRNPAQLHVSTLKGAFVGTLDRVGGARGAIDIRDKKALREAADINTEIISRELAAINERHSEQNDQLALDKAHNKAIEDAWKAETKGLTTAEKIGLAAGADAQKQIEDRQAARTTQRETAAVARDAFARAAELSDTDKQAFLTQEDPAAPANTSATGSANKAAQAQTLSDYL